MRSSNAFLSQLRDNIKAAACDDKNNLGIESSLIHFSEMLQREKLRLQPNHEFLRAHSHLAISNVLVKSIVNGVFGTPSKPDAPSLVVAWGQKSPARLLVDQMELLGLPGMPKLTPQHTKYVLFNTTRVHVAPCL